MRILSIRIDDSIEAGKEMGRSGRWRRARGMRMMEALELSLMNNNQVTIECRDELGSSTAHCNTLFQIHQFR